MSGGITTGTCRPFQVTEGCVHEVNLARRLDLPGGSIVVSDRGYTDCAWCNQLNSKGIHFVTRQKKNACYTVIDRHCVSRTSDITSDQTIRLTSTKADQCQILLRRVGYRDP
jgi:hypothetical protein